MDRMIFSNLNIEVTRRCNMHCEHCMRGDAENKDVSRETIETLLKNTEWIEHLTFTGGEPTLNIKAIKDTLALCKQYKIPVYDFYIETNGKKVTNEFLLTCFNWYSYCLSWGDYGDFSSVVLSTDNFHEPISEKNKNKLKRLSFFSDKNTDFTKTRLLNIGRAVNINSNDYKKCQPNTCTPNVSWSSNTYYIDGQITLTVAGDILSDCDYAYTDTDHLKIGSVNDPEWLDDYYDENLLNHWKDR